MYKNREFNINLRSKGRLAAFEKYTPGICIALALILAALVTGWVCSRAEMISRAELQEHLADEVLRFHVLANSDSEADQAQKLAVRDAVLDYLEAEMPQDPDEEETERWIRGHVDEIGAVSRDAAAAYFRQETIRRCGSRSARRKGTTGGACSTRRFVLWIQPMRSCLKRDGRN